MKLKSFINNAEVIELNKNINSKIYFELKSLIRNENSDSLLSKLSDKLLKEYLSYCSISNYFYLYVCLLDNKIIGYSIFVKNYKIQKNDFFFLSFKILLDQLLKFNLIPLLNFFLIITNLENILINKSNLNLINTSLNLNLLAIKKNYQSKGIGQFFIKSCLKNIKKKIEFEYLITETFNPKSLLFYKKKLNFKYLGIKLRFFRILKVLILKN